MCEPATTSPLEDVSPERLDFPALLGVPPRCLQQGLPRFLILELDGLLRCLDAHATLLVHGDGGTRLEAGALGDEQRGETGVACLQREVVERLWRMKLVRVCNVFETEQAGWGGGH